MNIIVKSNKVLYVKERWIITELRDSSNPTKEYYVSDIGRVMNKDYNRKSRLYSINFDPSKSKAKEKSGYKFHVQRKPIKVRKLVYHSFNKIPLDVRLNIKSIDNDIFNVRLDNLKDTSKKDRMNRIDSNAVKHNVYYTLNGEKWIDMGLTNNHNTSLKYFVSDKGRIASVKGSDLSTLKMVCDYNNGKGKPDNRGYLNFGVNKTHYYIHRLVACYFYHVPYSSPLQVHHINAIKTDNRLSNLKFVNPAEHYEADRLTHVGEARNRNYKSARRLSDEVVRQMRKMYDEDKLSQMEISRQTGIDHGTIRQVVKRITYKDVK